MVAVQGRNWNSFQQIHLVENLVTVLGAPQLGVIFVFLGIDLRLAPNQWKFDIFGCLFKLCKKMGKLLSSWDYKKPF